MKCSECGSEMIEDSPDGQYVCTDCGLCERMLVADHSGYDAVDWQRCTVTTKSEHVPLTYCANLIKRLNIDTSITDELLRMYKAVLFWSQRNLPEGRKSNPSYVSF